MAITAVTFFPFILILSCQSQITSSANPDQAIVPFNASASSRTGKALESLQNWWAVPLNGYSNPTFLVQLSDISFDKIVNSDYSVIVIDPQEAQFDRDELMELRAKNKTVLAHVSIGLADNRKAYWRDQWTTSLPDFILKEDPVHPGKYFVQYWKLYWQRILLRFIREQVLELGYSGLFLDYMSVYRNEANEDINRPNEMIALLRTIRVQARQMFPGTLIIANNVAELYKMESFSKNVDGLAAENVWFVNETDLGAKVNQSSSSSVLDNLRTALRDGKVILVVDYSSKPDNVCAFYSRCYAEKFFCDVTDNKWSGVARVCDRPKPTVVVNPAASTMTTTTRKPSSNRSSSQMQMNFRSTAVHSFILAIFTTFLLFR